MVTKYFAAQKLRIFMAQTLLTRFNGERRNTCRRRTEIETASIRKKKSE